MRSLDPTFIWENMKCCFKPQTGDRPLTLEASQVEFSLQYAHSLSHCGHMTIFPPISGSHTSLLRRYKSRN